MPWPGYVLKWVLITMQGLLCFLVSNYLLFIKIKMKETIEAIKENPFHIPSFKVVKHDELPQRQISNASADGKAYDFSNS